MRKLKKEEIDLIAFLLRDKHEYKQFIDELDNLLVEEMNDGGMGSLRFISKSNKKSILKDEVSIINLKDADGVPVRFALNLNTNGEIYELDVFKGDFSQLKQFPYPPYEKM
jgi:hypothetical protein